MTKDQHAARQLIGNWLAKQKIKLLKPMTHVCPRCYVLARPALSRVVYAVPHMDLDPQVLALRGADRHEIAHVFDPNIKVGDWVASAYIITAHYGQHVVVAWPKPSSKPTFPTLESTAMNVYELDDHPTFYAAHSPEQATALYKQDTGESPEDGYPRQCSDAELDAEIPVVNENEEITQETTTMRAFLSSQKEPGFLCSAL